MVADDGGRPGDDIEGSAGAALARLLRGWWQDASTDMKQGSLARRIGVSQATLSRYLDPGNPALARPDAIRALHTVLRRPPEDLDKALALHAAAERPRTERQREPRPESPPAPPSPPSSPDPAAPAARTGTGTAGGARTGTGPGAAVAAGAGGDDVPGPAVPAAPDPGQPAGPATSPSSGGSPAAGAGTRGRAARPLLYVAAAVVVLAVVTVVVLVLSGGDGSKPSAGASISPPAPAPAAATGPSAPAAPSCQADSCLGLDPSAAGCTDPQTLVRFINQGQVVELRHSKACAAAWTRITFSTVGDTAEIRDDQGRVQSRQVSVKTDTYSPMVPARPNAPLTACGTAFGRTECRTVSPVVG